MSNTVYELNGTTLTVKPIGELDSITSPAFEKELRGHLPGITSLIVDFEQVSDISSAGLRVFLSVEQTLESMGADIKLIRVNEYILEILKLVGFLDIIPVE